MGEFAVPSAPSTASRSCTSAGETSTSSPTSPWAACWLPPPRRRHVSPRSAGACAPAPRPRDPTPAGPPAAGRPRPPRSSMLAATSSPRTACMGCTSNRSRERRGSDTSHTAGEGLTPGYGAARCLEPARLRTARALASRPTATTPSSTWRLARRSAPPSATTEAPLYLVTLEEAPPAPAAPAADPRAVDHGVEGGPAPIPEVDRDAHIAALRQELLGQGGVPPDHQRRGVGDLQGQELKSSNEEMQLGLTKELHSTTRNWKTLKEDSQSVNEELRHARTPSFTDEGRLLVTGQQRHQQPARRDGHSAPSSSTTSSWIPPASTRRHPDREPDRGRRGAARRPPGLQPGRVLLAGERRDRSAEHPLTGKSRSMI